MKWLIVLLLLLALALTPAVAIADTSAGVTITAWGYICEAPGGFAITYISDYELGLSWTKGLGANNTMVRAAIGRVPADRDDGYLVYYGDGTYATDWSQNLDTLDAKVYYRAWSENAGGIWASEYGEGFIEGIGMKLIAFIVLALGLMIAAFVFKKQALMMAAGLGFVGLGVYMRLQSVAIGWADWDIYMLFFWLGITLAIVCFFESWLVARKSQIEEQVKEEGETYMDSYGEMMAQIAKLRRFRARR